MSSIRSTFSRGSGSNQNQVRKEEDARKEEKAIEMDSKQVSQL